ncbi:MAG: response regulator transcription factor [Paludibacteraceae bacterium]|nr:response regulator transcription factor [Paludibacteraceae bacterium]
MVRRIHIAIVEPSVIIRNGIVSVLKRLNLDIDIVEISDMPQLQSLLEKHNPDVVIIDPTQIGMFSLQHIKENLSGSKKFIALQSNLADASALKGYDEFISLYDSVEQIKTKVESVISKNKQDDSDKQELSQREKEIVSCIVKGLTNKQIAEVLHLSVHTVMTHRRNISGKLQIHSSAGLAIYAIVNKLVSLDEIKNLKNI